LYRKSINRYGAFVGILVGGITAAIWPYFEKSMNTPIPALVAGFVFSLIAIEGISFLTRRIEPAIEL
jgi:Na+/proline symporter